MSEARPAPAPSSAARLETGAGAFSSLWRFFRQNSFVILLLALTFSVRVLWAVVIPAWQTPDEIGHFAYVERLGENLTVTPDNHVPVNIGRVESLTGIGSVAFHSNITQVFAPKSLDGPHETDVESLPTSLRNEPDVPRGNNSSTDYPPTYFLVASLVYRMFSGFDIFTILFSLRVLSALISTATMFVGYLTLKRFFGDEHLALGSALIVALAPMYAYEGMAVNPDVLIWLAFAVLLYVITRALDDGLTPRWNLYAALTIVAGLWVKQTFLIAIPIYLVFLGFLWLKKTLTLKQGAVYAATTAALIALLDGWLYLSGIIRTSSEYPSGQRQARSISGFIEHLHDRWREYVKTYDMFWGYFGWLDTPLSLRVFDLIRLGTGIAVVGLCFYLAYSLYRRQPDWKALCYGSISIVYVAIWIVLNYIRVTSGEVWLLQGRYFFPIIVPIIALLVRGLMWYVPAGRSRDVVLVALVVGVVWLNADALFGYIIPRYYL